MRKKSKTYEAVERAAKIAAEEGEMSMASVLYCALGFYVLDSAREFARDVELLTRIALAENMSTSTDEEFPSSVDVG